MRLADVADTEQGLRLSQSIPSKKAEPFKLSSLADKGDQAFLLNVLAYYWGGTADEEKKSDHAYDDRCRAPVDAVGAHILSVLSEYTAPHGYIFLLALLAEARADTQYTSAHGGIV